MPYTITTKDGITVRNIPDNVPPDSIELKARVERIRRGEPLEQSSAVAQIPGGGPQPAPAQESGILDRIAGAGEAGLTVGTGTLGYLAGLVSGGNEAIKALLYGATGTQPAPGQMPDPSGAFAREQQALTYQPRTEAGRDALSAVAQAAAPLAPLAGMGGELAMIANAARTAAATPARVAARASAEGVARDVAGPGAAAATSQAIDATSKAATQVQEAAKLLPSKTRALVFGEQSSTPGTLGSVGAAGTEMATQRATTAEGLPVPIRLTEGQRTRDFAQQRFEQETAKDPTLGAPLRENSARQNLQLAQNLDAMIDGVGATAPDMRETGRVVTQELTRAAARSKTEYRSLYQQADRAGELAEPVDLAPLAAYLNENRAGRSSAPILATIADELGVIGVGGGSLADGTIAAGKATLKQAENLRKAVNRFVKSADPNDVRVGAEIKGVIDQITEGIGGSLYTQARKARQRHSQLYEDNAIVSDLLTNRRNTADRRVALEDVFNRSILNGDRESIGLLRRTLDVGDQRAGVTPGTTGPGAQAWKELQGATLRHLLGEATKNVATDIAGNPIFSAAKLDAAVRALDKGNRLDFVLGRRNAQMVRDINEVAKVVLTAPPGAVNTSNTGSVVLAALAEAGATASLTGLPVPALSLLRAGNQMVKDAKVRNRVNAALNPGGSPRK